MGDYSEVNPPSTFTVYDDSTSITVLPNGRKWRRQIGFTGATLETSPSGDRAQPDPQYADAGHVQPVETSKRRA
jgi:hypothetical protein